MSGRPAYVCDACGYDAREHGSCDCGMVHWRGPGPSAAVERACLASAVVAVERAREAESVALSASAPDAVYLWSSVAASAWHRAVCLILAACSEAP